MTETQTLGAALEQVAQPKETKTVLDLIQSMQPELQKSLQSEAAAEILIRHYYSALRFNELLRQCTAESLVAALLLSAQVRLEPGPLGHVYLVPRRNKGVHEVVWQLGYTGIVELARRTDRVAGLESTVVWDNDTYTRPSKDQRGIHYSYAPGDESEQTERVGVLVTWQEKSGGKWFPRALDVPRARIERAKKASPALKSNGGIWVSDPTAAWAKTGIHYARPWLPLSSEFAYATAMDDAVMHGVDLAGEPEATVVDLDVAAVDAGEAT